MTFDQKSRPKAVSVISDGCHFSGTMLLHGESRIGGKVDGQIVSFNTLIIEQTAQIKADISGNEVYLCGTIDGTIQAQGFVRCLPGSTITGKIITERLIIEDGAKVNAQVVHHKFSLKTAENNLIPMKKTG